MMWPTVGILDTHTTTTHDITVTPTMSNKDVTTTKDVTTQGASKPINGNMPTSWTPSPSVARQVTDLREDHSMTHHHQETRRRGAKTRKDRLARAQARASPTQEQVHAIVIVVYTHTTSTQSLPRTLQEETPGHDAK